MPISPLRLLLLILCMAVFIGVVQLGILRIAFDRLGLSPESAYLLLICTLMGSFINLPLFTIKAEAGRPPAELPEPLKHPPLVSKLPFSGKTLVAINLGGAVVPVAFSLYLMAHNPLGVFSVAAAVTLVAAISYAFSRPISGLGIGMPMLVAPITAALTATLLDPAQRAPLAYIGGTLGVLIGADLARLRDIPRLGAPVASIGGAGTFDGVFLTGLVAVLLA